MSYLPKRVIEEVTADDIIQEHMEQEIVQEFIDAESTDEEIDRIVMLVEAGLNKDQIRAFLSSTGRFVN